MYKKYFKRFLDIVLSIILLPLLLIILIIFAPIIFFQDKGNIFYNALRLGKNGNIFKMYKLRSMKINAPDIRNADGSTFNSNIDSRLTKIGMFIRKTSIDEIPQLINILKGDMSFIGPRPDLPEHRELYTDNESRKLEIRPGVSGYSQAYFRNSIPWKERIKNDIYYIDNLTFTLDVKILFKTISSVLHSESIYVEQNSVEGEAINNDKNEPTNVR